MSILSVQASKTHGLWRPLLAVLGLLVVLLAAWLYALRGSAWPFSLHMGAHLLLSYAAALLLALAFPLRWKVPFVPAFVLLNAVTAGLHIPAVHHALMLSPAGDWIVGTLFLSSGYLFWRAVSRGGWNATWLLLAQMAACALIGALVTFSGGAVFHSGREDVALGGVLMWVVGGAVVMSAAFFSLLHNARRTP